MKTDAQIEKLYERALHMPMVPSYVTKVHMCATMRADAIHEIRHALAAKTDAAAGRYLEQKEWGCGLACARALRRAARIPSDKPAKPAKR